MTERGTTLSKHDYTADILRYLAEAMANESDNDPKSLADSTAAAQEVVQDWLASISYDRRGAVLDAEETPAERKRSNRSLLYEAIHMVTSSDKKAVHPTDRASGDLRLLERLLIQLHDRATLAELGIKPEPVASVPNPLDSIYSAFGVKNMDELVGAARVALAPLADELRKVLENNKPKQR